MAGAGPSGAWGQLSAAAAGHGSPGWPWAVIGGCDGKRYLPVAETLSFPPSFHVASSTNL